MSASITCSRFTGARSTRSSAAASAFVDDYDLHVAHFLVQGCDVWMNNPRKPLEASGTSGMKAAINGTPHMSIGDGWWAEGFTGENGWLIEGDADPNDQVPRTGRTRRRFTHLLEKQLVPTFYARDANGIPRAVAANRQAVDPDGAPPLQRPPDGQGICPRHVFACPARGTRDAIAGRGAAAFRGTATPARRAFIVDIVFSHTDYPSASPYPV